MARFNDSEDMLEDTWNMEYAGANTGLGIWDSYYPVYPTRLKKYDNVGLAEAIVSSILSTGLCEHVICLPKFTFFRILLTIFYWTLDLLCFISNINVAQFYLFIFYYMFRTYH